VTTGSGSNFIAGDGVSATYSRVSGEPVGPYAITATLSAATAGALDNYIINNTAATFTISQRSASVTPNAASKVYGDADPAFSGTLTGFVPADGVTAAYSRTAGRKCRGKPVYDLGSAFTGGCSVELQHHRTTRRTSQSRRRS
jgi:hypothetical protein